MKFNMLKMFQVLQDVRELIDEDDNRTPDLGEVVDMGKIIVDGLKANGAKLSPEVESALAMGEMMAKGFGNSGMG